MQRFDTADDVLARFDAFHAELLAIMSSPTLKTNAWLRGQLRSVERAVLRAKRTLRPKVAQPPGFDGPAPIYGRGYAPMLAALQAFEDDALRMVLGAAVAEDDHLRRAVHAVVASLTLPKTTMQAAQNESRTTDRH